MRNVTSQQTTKHSGMNHPKGGKEKGYNNMQDDYNINKVKNT